MNTLLVNLGCFKCITDINSLSIKKNLFITLFMFYHTFKSFNPSTNYLNGHHHKPPTFFSTVASLLMRGGPSCIIPESRLLKQNDHNISKALF